MQQILFSLLTIYLHGYTNASKGVIITTKDGKSYLAKTEPAKNLNKSSTEKKKFSSASRQLNRNFAEFLRFLGLDEPDESKESKESHGSVTFEKSEESEGSEESKSKTHKFVDVSGTKDGCGRCFTNDKSSAIMITYQSY